MGQSCFISGGAGLQGDGFDGVGVGRGMRPEEMPEAIPVQVAAGDGQVLREQLHIGGGLVVLQQFTRQALARLDVFDELLGADRELLMFFVAAVRLSPLAASILEAEFPSWLSWVENTTKLLTASLI